MTERQVNDLTDEEVEERNRPFMEELLGDLEDLFKMAGQKNARDLQLEVPILLQGQPYNMRFGVTKV